MKIIVRITDKSGSRIERHTLDDSPLTIGRAWDNDVILQDQFVDADHLSVRLLTAGDDAGRIELHDLQSTNGTLLANKRLGELAIYRSGDSIKVGDTLLEILDSSIAVEQTSIRSFWFFMRERSHSLPFLMWLTLITLAVAILDGQFLAAQPSKLTNVLLTIALTLSLLLVWSLLFGFISKLIRGESNIRTHWALACIALIVTVLLGSLLSVILFNLQQVELGKLLTTLVFSSALGVFLYALLTYATHMGGGAKLVSSVIMILGIVTTVYSDLVFKEPHQRWSASSQTETANLPPTLLFRSRVNVDEYIQQTSRLFVEQDHSPDIQQDAGD